ncbi:MAG: helix-turn-helix transcriptional regulator [Caldilinea sp.]|nr:helix-turn-helix transcriptional regulator [Caldilinea sp.]
MTTIGETIGLWRKERGWTQEELAAIADMPQTHISAIETGRIVDPRASAVEKLARAFGVSVDDLLAGADGSQDGGVEYRIEQHSVALREMTDKWEALDDEQRQVVLTVFRQFERDNEVRVVE